MGNFPRGVAFSYARHTRSLSRNSRGTILDQDEVDPFFQSRLVMHRIFTVIFRGAMLLALGVLWQAAASAAVLYDANPGQTPVDDGWFFEPDNGTYLMAPDSVGMSATPGGTLLQTLNPNDDRAGFFRRNQDSLNRTTGYTLSFNVKINGESHETPDRSGFSVIALSDDKWGIELSFWPNQVFAKESDVPLFTRDEFVPATTTNLSEYFLTIQGDNYTLTGASLDSPLTGPLRLYSAHPIYNTTNFLFLGDNTTSAGANILLGSISLQAIPEPATCAVVSLILAGIVAYVRRQRKLAA